VTRDRQGRPRRWRGPGLRADRLVSRDVGVGRLQRLGNRIEFTASGPPRATVGNVVSSGGCRPHNNRTVAPGTGDRTGTRISPAPADDVPPVKRINPTSRWCPVKQNVAGAHYSFSMFRDGRIQLEAHQALQSGHRDERFARDVLSPQNVAWLLDDGRVERRLEHLRFEGRWLMSIRSELDLDAVYPKPTSRTT